MWCASYQPYHSWHSSHHLVPNNSTHNSYFTKFKFNFKFQQILNISISHSFSPTFIKSIETVKQNWIEMFSFTRIANWPATQQTKWKKKSPKIEIMFIHWRRTNDWLCWSCYSIYRNLHTKKKRKKSEITEMTMHMCLCRVYMMCDVRCEYARTNEKLKILRKLAQHVLQLQKSFNDRNMRFQWNFEMIDVCSRLMWCAFLSKLFAITTHSWRFLFNLNETTNKYFNQTHVFVHFLRSQTW